MTDKYIVACIGCGLTSKRSNTCRFKCSTCKNPKKYPKNWGVIRNQVIHRDKKCLVCGDKEKLHVHHIDGNIKNNDLSNLETKCNQCHLSNHRKPNMQIKEIKYFEFGKRIVYKHQQY